MRIALFNTVTPFVRGGAEILVDDLYSQLELRGHTVTLFRIPFPNDHGLSLLETILTAQNLNFDAYDMVIAFKFPAYCASHRRKVLWVLHQFRQIYELFGHEYGLQDNDTGNALKNIITDIDIKEIRGAHKVFTIAKEVTKRLKKYNDLDSKVLNPPLLDEKRYYKGITGDFIFYLSRVDGLKRQHLAIEAMAYVKTDVKLIIGGKCDEPGYYKRLEEIINKNNLSKKIKIENRWIAEEEKLSYLANSLAVVYPPYKEDYGFITLEAFYSSKPVISCIDSGCPIDFVINSENGFIVESTPQALAECFDKLYSNKILSEKMGEAAYKTIIEKNINWDETIRRLLCE